MAQHCTAHAQEVRGVTRPQPRSSVPEGIGHGFAIAPRKDSEPYLADVGLGIDKCTGGHPEDVAKKHCDTLRSELKLTSYECHELLLKQLGTLAAFQGDNLFLSCLSGEAPCRKRASPRRALMTAVARFEPVTIN